MRRVFRLKWMIYGRDANNRDPKLLLIFLRKTDTIETDWNHFESQIHNANVYTCCKTGPCIPSSSHRPSKPLASVNLPNFPRNLKVQPRLTTVSLTVREERATAGQRASLSKTQKTSIKSTEKKWRELKVIPVWLSVTRALARSRESCGSCSSTIKRSLSPPREVRQREPCPRGGQRRVYAGLDLVFARVMETERPRWAFLGY